MANRTFQQLVQMAYEQRDTLKRSGREPPSFSFPVSPEEYAVLWDIPREDPRRLALDSDRSRILGIPLVIR